MIWEPFVLALFLGVIVSAGLYFAYLWPSVEPEEQPAGAGADSRTDVVPAPSEEARTAEAEAIAADPGARSEDAAEEADEPAPSTSAPS